MNGLMMDFPLTVNAIFRRGEQMFRGREIVWRNADKSVSRYTFADFTARAHRLATALETSPATVSRRWPGTTARTSRPISASR